MGVLAAFDRGRDGAPFTADDEQLLRTFASSAANAVAIKRSVEAERLRAAIAAADAERGRWARELHDQTLQALGGLRVLLASAQRRNQALADEPAIRQAIEDIELETDNLRAIINDLRPSLLDDLGLLPAIDALLERRREAGLEIESELALPDPERGGDALDSELETTVYRVLQEALTNVAKHAQASRARVSARLTDGEVVVEVQDDGVGFEAESPTSGFGLAGMRERVYLAGGTLEIESARKAPRSARGCRPRRPAAWSAAQSPIRPRRSAKCTSSARVRSLSLRWTLARCVSTVRRERWSLLAISALVWPSAISRSTSVSRGLRPSPLTVLSERVEARRNLGADVLLAACRSPHRRGQLGVGPVLEDERDGTGVEGVAGERWAALHGQYHDLGLGDLRAQAADRLDARAIGHLKIQYQHLGPVAVHVAPDRREISRLGDHVDAILAIEQQPQAAAQERMVVGQHDTDRRGPGVEIRHGGCELQVG